MTGFDWAGLLALATRRHGLRPAEFWSLTPLEFMVIAGLAAGGAAPMNRVALDALIAAFPDAQE